MRPTMWIVSVAFLAGCLGPPPPEDGGSPSPGPTEPGFACPDGTRYGQDHLLVDIETSKGRIVALLYGRESPLSVCNFLRYALEHFYDNTVWHRVCTHVIQAGGFDPYTREQKPTHDPIKNEANASGLRNYKGTLGMARNSTPDSATSHFFVNLKDNNYLDWDGPYAPGYAVFGNVTKGADVVQAIAAGPTIPDPPAAPPVLPGGCDGKPAPGTATTITDVRLEA